MFIMNNINNDDLNFKNKDTEEKIKKIQISMMDSDKCKEFAQKLVQYITGNQ